MTEDELASYLTIDLTTIGRRSGEPRRIEIWWFRVDGEFYITGTGGRRDWLANVRANPDVTVHVNGNDLAARATEITDPDVRREVLTNPQLNWYSTQQELDELVRTAPMIQLSWS